MAFSVRTSASIRALPSGATLPALANREEVSDRHSLTVRAGPLPAELPQKRLTRFVFARRDPGFAVRDHASNGRGREYLVVDNDRDWPVHVRPRKILETFRRLGCELDHQRIAVGVADNLRL